MTLPGLLIVGGMKCGSTTLYRDLAISPDVHFPLDKEPENLTSDHVLSPDGERAYRDLFKAARPGQLCAEASTAYTKKPRFTGVADRARRLLGDQVKVVYIARDPVRRIESHLAHKFAAGAWPHTAADEALDLHPELIEFSRYAYQIEDWIDSFGHDAVRLVVLEDYTANRQVRCAQLWEWLGVRGDPEAVRPDVVYNKSERKPVMRGAFAGLARTRAYRAALRPLLSQAARDRLRSALLPKATIQPVRLGPDGVRRVRDRLGPDVAEFARLCDRCGLAGVDPAAVWGFTADPREEAHA